MQRIFITLLFSSFPFLFFCQKPKLVVGIVVDQMCYEYLYRFQPHFEKGGFNRLMTKGVNCRNTNYNYVPTVTGPGHASIYTGTTPSNHGIVNNEWYVRSTQKMTNCVADESVHTVGSDSKKGKASPHNLETVTLTDQLKMTYPDARVYAMSIKDRGAILPGGHLSNGTFWNDNTTGKFISSSYFGENLPEWLVAFNATHNADTYLQDWNLSVSKESYINQLDNSPYEVTLEGKKTPEFPYNFTQFAKGNYSMFCLSPFANTLLTDLAIETINQTELGSKKDVTDMLCISYSTPDLVGHAFGPYSMEIEDIYIRLDKDLSKLMTYLDKTIGKNDYLLFLTADHAVVPVPQQLKDQKLPGGYFDAKKAMAKIKSLQKETFGASLVEKEENLNIYLNHRAIDSLNLDLHTVINQTNEWVLSMPEVKCSATSMQLTSGSSDDPWVKMIREGFHKDRSGDVLFILKPGYLSVDEDTEASHKGTSHGAAYNYDTHVPLLWYGNHLKHQEIVRPIQIVDVAPTLTHFLNLQRNGSMIGRPIVELFGGE